MKIVNWSISLSISQITAGLFMGVSILSFIEIIYYCTIRLVCNIYDSKKTPKVALQKIKSRRIDAIVWNYKYWFKQLAQIIKIVMHASFLNSQKCVRYQYQSSLMQILWIFNLEQQPWVIYVSQAKIPTVLPRK
jgi:hypothetical protein